MRNIVRSSKFKKEYRKIDDKNCLLDKFIERLDNGENVSKDIKYKGKILQGQFKGYEHYHLSANTILIYKKDKDNIWLGSIGSHGNVYVGGSKRGNSHKGKR